MTIRGYMNILMIPHSIWAKIPGRFDYFKEYFKQKNEVHIITWDMPYPLTFNSINKIKATRDKFTHKIERNVILHHLSMPFIIPPFNHRAVRAQILEIVNEYQIDVIISQSFFWDLIPPFGEVPVIYDMVDDHLSFFHNARFPENLTGRMGRVKDATILQLENSDHTTFVSSVLQDRYKEKCNSSSLLPNGVFLEKYRKQDQEYSDLQLDKYDHVVGYVGYFGEWSNLFETVLNVQKFLDENNGVLIVAGIGPEIERVKKELYNLDRVIFTGLLDVNQIPALINTFDMALLPFKKNPYTDGASPIKFFEYSAAGLPVVSSKLEEVVRMDFNNAIFYDDIKDIGSALGKAKDFEFDKKRLEDKLKNYDWQKLGKSLLKIIESYTE